MLRKQMSLCNCLNNPGYPTFSSSSLGFTAAEATARDYNSADNISKPPCARTQTLLVCCCSITLSCAPLPLIYLENNCGVPVRSEASQRGEVQECIRASGPSHWLLWEQIVAKKVPSLQTFRAFFLIRAPWELKIATKVCKLSFFVNNRGA